MLLNNTSYLGEIIRIIPNIITIILLVALYIIYRNDINSIIKSFNKNFSNSSLKEINLFGAKIDFTLDLASGLIKEGNVPKGIVPYNNFSILKRIEFIIRNDVHIHTLWIEDNKIKILRQIKMLENIGMKIDHVESSEIALKKLKTNKYDLILSDIERDDNETEGIDFLKDIVENKKINIPTIFYTGEYKDSDGYPKQNPRYAFGVACMPYDLLLLCLDVLERNIKGPENEIKK